MVGSAIDTTKDALVTALDGVTAGAGSVFLEFLFQQQAEQTKVLIDLSKRNCNDIRRIAKFLDPNEPVPHPEMANMMLEKIWRRVPSGAQGQKSCDTALDFADEKEQIKNVLKKLKKGDPDYEKAMKIFGDVNEEIYLDQMDKDDPEIKDNPTVIKDGPEIKEGVDTDADDKFDFSKEYERWSNPTSRGYMLADISKASRGKIINLDYDTRGGYRRRKTRRKTKNKTKRKRKTKRKY